MDVGVSARRGILCALREPTYADDQWAFGPSGLRHSEEAQDGVVILPLYRDTTAAEQ